MSLAQTGQRRSWLACEKSVASNLPLLTLQLSGGLCYARPTETISLPESVLWLLNWKAQNSFALPPN